MLSRGALEAEHPSPDGFDHFPSLWLAPFFFPCFYCVEGCGEGVPPDGDGGVVVWCADFVGFAVWRVCSGFACDQSSGRLGMELEPCIWFGWGVDEVLWSRMRRGAELVGGMSGGDCGRLMRMHATV